MGAKTWPEEHIDALRKLWGEGLKAPHIAQRLNKQFGTKYTKNSIIGTKHRLGLANRHQRTPADRTPHASVPNWNAVRVINGAEVTLEAYVIELNKTKTCSQIAEQVNEEWPVSLIHVYMLHQHVYNRMHRLGYEVVKLVKTPRQSAMSGAFAHAPAKFETPPKTPSIERFAATDEVREGTNERNSCKWPVNDDVRDLQLCGKLITLGAYCATHGALAYTVAPSKKRTTLIAREQSEHVSKPKVVDVHANRKALTDDCRIGTCSVNNCLFPSCTEAPSIVMELPNASEWLPDHG